jgi:hypothetical protein
MQPQTLFHRATLFDYLPKAHVAGCPPPIVRHLFPLAQGTSLTGTPGIYSFSGRLLFI